MTVRAKVAWSGATALALAGIAWLGPWALDDDGSGALHGDPLAAGRDLSHGACEGRGLTHRLETLPMREEDFSTVIPYGLMIGDHVTPIDHQYFTPADFASPRDTYEVRAMAPSRLVEVTERTTRQGREYRMVFSVSCTVLYYYDLVTSLASRVRDAVQRAGGPGVKSALDLTVTAGEIVGRIGGRTLDFAVWDTDHPLPGFVVPEHYLGERWKLYTADPLDYYTDDVRKVVRSRLIRTAEPVSGRIDFDVDGRLVGNWFVEDSGGYEGDRSDAARPYSRTHLAFAPNHLDPSHFHVSVGEFDGRPRQFAVHGNEPDPATVGEDTGIVRYDLVDFDYVTEDGALWDRKSFATNLRVVPREPSLGCALTELIGPRRLRFEVVPAGPCAETDGFTPAARVYER